MADQEIQQEDDQEKLLKQQDQDRDDIGTTDNLYGFVKDEYAEADGVPKARDENFFQSLGACFCPKIGILQFITIVSLVDILIYIITCCVYGLDNGSFLQPDNRGVEWGWSDVKKIRTQWQLWRFITPTLLHGNLEHIAGNMFGQVYMGTGIEAGLGPVRTVILYWLSGLGGIMLSMCVRPNTHGLGASTAIFGLVGFYFAYFCSNFNYMGRVNYGQRIAIGIYVGLMVIMQSPLMAQDERVDNIGHLGGFITGALVGFAITEQYDADARARENENDRVPDRYTREEYEAKCACCCFFWRFFQVVTGLWFLALFIYFYVFIDVDELMMDSEDT